MKRFLCLFLLTCSAALAQSKGVHIRGTVQDAATKKPIAEASVVASGDAGQQNEITDDNGFFRLLIQGVAPGDLVRLRVVKTGYAVYDQQIVTSEEMPITINLHSSTSASSVKASPKSAALHKPTLSIDPVTARYIEQLSTSGDPTVRLNALNVIAKSASNDPAALSAVAAAVNDRDYRVREYAAYDLGIIGKDTPQVVTGLRIALDDVEPEVHSYAIAALGSFPKDKVAVDALFHVMGSPPNCNTKAAIALHNEGLDDPRITAVLIYGATVDKDQDAAAALAQLHLNSSNLSSLFASLGVPPNINRNVMNILGKMNVNDPRLMAAYIDEARKGDNDAILALGKYPQSEEALTALFAALGRPPTINITAMNVLSDLRIDDPRLTDAWIATADNYNSASVIRLLEKAPFSPDLISRLISHLDSSIDTSQNWFAQISIDLLLRGGNAARQALYNYVASAPSAAQALLAIAWLEMDHKPGTKAEILRDIRVADVRAMLLHAMKLSAKGYVSVPDYPNHDDECNDGLSLRAAMGLSVLGIVPLTQRTQRSNPENQPLDLLAKVIDDNVDKVCATYAVIALGWTGPDALSQPAVQAAMPSLMDDLFGCAGEVSPEVTFNTFAQIGDLHTLAQIDAQLHSDKSTCALNSIRPVFTAERMSELTARIQSRLSAR